MISKATIERITGILLLVLPAIIIAVSATVVEVDTRREHFLEDFQEIADNQDRYAASIALMFISSLVTVGAAAALYLTFRPHERTLAMFGSFGFLAAGATLMVGVMTGTALHDLAQEYGATSGDQAARVATTARAIALVRDGSFLGFGFLALGLLAFGALIAWSGAVHRGLGWLAVLSTVLALLGLLTFVEDDFWLFFFFGGIAVLLWFVFTGGWLLWRGTREATPGA